MRNVTSKQLFEEAKNHIPGGVNSPVRAFKAVNGTPPFIRKAYGQYMYDEDGNQYIDYINSWGPMLLGHAHPLVTKAVKTASEQSLSFGAPTAAEVHMAKLVKQMFTSIEKLRMVNSGTEATMSAIRLARGYTGKNKIIKFEGCYHGHGDAFLIAAGSGALTMGTPDSPGVTAGVANDTLTAQYNNKHSVEQLVKANKDDLAAIIIEPVAGNMGCITPEEGFLEFLRSICDEEKIVLIFDEVMTGFRLSKGGAQELYNIYPDITTLGKIIGGGMPVGAYGGKKEIMDFVSPDGPVYQAGTLSGNPVAMAAGFATLKLLNEGSEIYNTVNLNTQRLVQGISENIKSLNLDYTINSVGSMFSLFFTSKKVRNFEDAKTCDTALFAKYFHEMLKRGHYLAPSQFESLFISSVLSEKDIDKFIKDNYDVLKNLN